MITYMNKLVTLILISAGFIYSVQSAEDTIPNSNYNCRGSAICLGTLQALKKQNCANLTFTQTRPKTGRTIAAATVCNGVRAAMLGNCFMLNVADTEDSTHWDMCRAIESTLFGSCALLPGKGRPADLCQGVEEAIVKGGDCSWLPPGDAQASCYAFAIYNQDYPVLKQRILDNMDGAERIAFHSYTTPNSNNAQLVRVTPPFLTYAVMTPTQTLYKRFDLTKLVAPTLAPPHALHLTSEATIQLPDASQQQALYEIIYQIQKRPLPTSHLRVPASRSAELAKGPGPRINWVNEREICQTPNRAPFEEIVQARRLNRLYVNSENLCSPF